MKIQERMISSDGSVKFLFRTVDGHLVEGVRFCDKKISNLCVSSMVGCVHKCTHCATGRLPYVRDLSSEEMLAQTHLMAEGKPYDLLFLGMGEPLLNYTAIRTAIAVLVDGPLRAASNVLIGTSGFHGLAEVLDDLAEEKDRPLLSVSVHGAPQSVRCRLIPHSRLFTLEALLGAFRRYQRITGDRITINYTPISEINDSDENYADFVNAVRTLECTVRIIPFNSVPNVTLCASNQERLIQLQEVLNKNGIPNIVRPNFATDIFAGCGQLGGLGWH